MHRNAPRPRPQSQKSDDTNSCSCEQACNEVMRIQNEFVECAAAKPGASSETKATPRTRRYGAADAATARKITNIASARQAAVAHHGRNTASFLTPRIFHEYHVCIGKAGIFFAFFYPRQKPEIMTKRAPG